MGVLISMQSRTPLSRIPERVEYKLGAAHFDAGLSMDQWVTLDEASRAPEIGFKEW